MLWKYCASMTFSTAVRYGIRWNCWNTNPIFSARTRFRSAADICATFSPSSRISPEEGRSRQPIKFTSVDLPEPEGPIMASHSPGATASEMLSRARMVAPFASALAEYSLLTFSRMIISLASQDHSGLHTPKQGNRHHCRHQSHGNAAQHDQRQHVESGHYRGMKANPANPGSGADSERKTDQRTGDP